MDLWGVSGGDIWTIIGTSGLFKYSYSITGKSVPGISAYLATLDKAGKLHLVLKQGENCCIYAYWQGDHWKRIPLPQLEVNVLMGLVVDAHDVPHILMVSPDGRINHLLYWQGSWRFASFPFTLARKPLCFVPEPSGKICLCWDHITGKDKSLYCARYSPGKGWSAPRLLGREKAETEVYVYHTSDDRLEWLAWEKQAEGYCIYYRVIEDGDSEKMVAEAVGRFTCLPDKQPALLQQGPDRLICWTSGGEFAFSLKPYIGDAWSYPQSDYLFFPAGLSPIFGWSTLIFDKLAFTKICGIQLEWPLILGAQQILPYCKAVLAIGSRANLQSPQQNYGAGPLKLESELPNPSDNPELESRPVFPHPIFLPTYST
ncbi:MAG: hypothetical protein ACPL5F_01050 [Moorellaceae bacterium]